MSRWKIAALFTFIVVLGVVTGCVIANALISKSRSSSVRANLVLADYEKSWDQFLKISQEIEGEEKRLIDESQTDSDYFSEQYPKVLKIAEALDYARNKLTAAGEILREGMRRNIRQYIEAAEQMINSCKEWIKFAKDDFENYKNPPKRIFLFSPVISRRILLSLPPKQVVSSER